LFFEIPSDTPRYTLKREDATSRREDRRLKLSIAIGALVLGISLTKRAAARQIGIPIVYYCYDDHYNPYGPFTVEVPPPLPPSGQLQKDLDTACAGKGYLGGDSLFRSLRKLQ
jgi:hypothetical protein